MVFSSQIHRPLSWTRLVDTARGPSECTASSKCGARAELVDPARGPSAWTQRVLYQLLHLGLEPCSKGGGRGGLVWCDSRVDSPLRLRLVIIALPTGVPLASFLHVSERHKAHLADVLERAHQVMPSNQPAVGAGSSRLANLEMILHPSGGMSHEHPAGRLQDRLELNSPMINAASRRKIEKHIACWS